MTTPIKILVVAEGRLNFDKGNGSSLVEMIDEVDSFPDPNGSSNPVFKTVKHEFTDSANLVKALSEQEFGQLWLFGQSEYPKDHKIESLLDATAIELISSKMKAGLGVFATGDHDEIGAPLCGRIPRVRFLRRWHRHADPAQSVPSSGGIFAAKTHTPALVLGGNEDLDSDAMPKTIWARNAVHRDGHANRRKVHPLFFHPNFGRISYLPDHMHEGVCCEPPTGDTDPAIQKMLEDEFPAKSKSRVVAWCMREGYFDQRPAEPVVHPVISCFDHETIGRVVTDSTFHHWIFENIQHLKTSPSLAWQHIRQYPRNIAAWLARLERPVEPLQLVVGKLLTHTPVISAAHACRALPSPQLLQQVGQAVLNALPDVGVDSGRAKRLLLDGQAGKTLLAPSQVLHLGQAFLKALARSEA